MTLLDDFRPASEDNNDSLKLCKFVTLLAPTTVLSLFKLAVHTKKKKKTFNRGSENKLKISVLLPIIK